MRYFLLCIPLLVLVNAGLTQPVKNLTADETVRIGLENNRQLQASEYQARAAGAAYRETRRQMLPSITGQGQYLRLSSNIPDFEFSLPPELFPSQTDQVFIAPAILNRYDMRLIIQQPLFNGNRLRNTTQAAGHRSTAALQSLRADETEMAFRIREAYWRLYQMREMQQVIETALKQVQSQLDIIQKMRDRGMALESDVLAVQARRSEVQLQQLDAEKAIKLSRLNLNYLTGFPLDTQIRQTDSVVVQPLSNDLETLTSLALQKRPDLGALSSELKATRAEVRAAQSQWFPQINLMGQYNYARPNAYIVPQEDVFTGTWEAGVSVSMNLWSWGVSHQRVQQAKYRERERAAQFNDFRESVRVEVRQQVLELERAHKSVSVAQDGVRESRAAFNVMQQRFQQGMALTAELLDAELTFRQAELRHVQALTDYASARAALTRAIGQTERLTHEN